MDGWVRTPFNQTGEVFRHMQLGIQGVTHFGDVLPGIAGEMNNLAAIRLEVAPQRVAPDFLPKCHPEHSLKRVRVSGLIDGISPGMRSGLHEAGRVVMEQNFRPETVLDLQRQFANFRRARVSCQLGGTTQSDAGVS